LFFYPDSVDIHERRKQTGISEGIVSFFQPFTGDEDPIECISTLKYTHLTKQVEPDIWLNMVIQHPDTIYGERQSNDVEAETIANNKFQTSLFQEEDSKLFHKVLTQFHSFFCMFHGSLTSLVDRHFASDPALLQKIMTDFTHNFNKYFFSRDYVPNLMWNLCFPGFFYCPIDRKTFLQAKYLQNGIFMEFEKQVKHLAIFHDEFFISSTLDNANSQTLYAYLVGCSHAQRQDRTMKVLNFKDVSKNTQTISNKNLQVEAANPGAEEQSDFCRINPNNSFTYVNKSIHGFVIGPHSFSEEDPNGAASIRNFAPVVHFQNEETGKTEVFRLMVYLGHKTMIAMLFEQNEVLEYKFLNQLDSHLAKHCPIISQLIDQALLKSVQPDDPCKFFYYNEGNMAVKISNLISRDMFNYELKLQLN